MRYQPVVGEWYQAPGRDLFEVVVFEPEDDVVEVQYYDGSLEEFDLDSWHELAVEPAEPPEDWSAPMDLSREDLDDREQPAPRMHDGSDFLNDVDGLS